MKGEKKWEKIFYGGAAEIREGSRQADYSSRHSDFFYGSFYGSMTTSFKFQNMFGNMEIETGTLMD